MKLLHFAHAMEANSILKSYKFKSENIKNLDLYKNEDSLLLISKEGIFETIKKISFVSARYNISEVINMGLAGMLSPKLQKNKIYEVRTVYRIGDKPEFQSFELGSSGIDLITYKERVMDPATSKKLSPFGDAVDLELWGLCFALKGQNIKISSYKIMSDLAGIDTKDFNPKDSGEFYANELLKFYQSLEEEDSTLKKEEEIDLGPFKNLYRTKQQDIKLKNYLKQIIKIKNLNASEIFKEYKINEIIERFPSKEGTNKVIDLFINAVNPFRAKTLELLANETKKIEAIGAKIHFDPNLEKKDFTLSMEINSDKNIENLILALKETTYSKIEAILNGDFNV